MAELIGGLPWQAGASTTLSVAGGLARCTATAPAVNPRIFKGPFSITNGLTYQIFGHVFMRTAAGGSVYVRVGPDNTMSAGGPFNVPSSVDVTMNGSANGYFFIASFTGNAWFGIVPLITASGQYAEIDDTTTILDPGGAGTSAASTLKAAQGGQGPFSDYCRRLILDQGAGAATSMTNQQLKESGPGFWADMARQGGTVLS